MAKRYVISMWMILYGLLCIGQQTKAGAVRSALPGEQQSDIADAIDRWNRQFKWRTRDDSADLVRDSSIDVVHLKSPGEKDLIVTDQSGCSPTGNCTIFVLLPGKNEYRVVMEGIGRT